jgi:hypothetical protein
MRLAKLVLAGIATFSLLTVLQPNASGAQSLATARGAGPALGSAPERVLIPIFHSGRSTSFYCYPRNYWWFYRPYTTATESYARCLPYFHYPPQAYKGRGGAGRFK